MPVLLKLITEDPRVGSQAGLVCILVVANGMPVERVGLSPYLALRLAEAISTEALALLAAGTPVIPLEKRKKR